MNNNTLYIIPARGGSKGIPRKNVKSLDGKPLIHYSIEVARRLADDKNIIVSTEDDEIASIAQSTGLAVNYRRPMHLATDTAGSREMMLDAMDYADKMGVKYDKVVLLQPTSPFRSVEDVQNCIALYRSDIDMVVSVVEASCNPYYNCFETDENSGFLNISKGDGCYTRRQDVPKAWEYNGAVYVINPVSLREKTMGEFSRRIPYEMPRERSLDLDTPLDWVIAETVIKQLKM